MRTVLLIAYHFPPVAGSSGVQRTLRFAQYLPEFGWKPIVLSVEPSAYERIDVGRNRLFGGRHPAVAALPDRWASWRLWAVRAGRRLVRERGIDVLWSTYPIATAHMIGAALAQRTGLPWVADFRDPMAQDGYPPDPRRWRSFKRIEEAAVAHARSLVFVSPSALDTYRRRYPDTPAERFVLLENGFDERSFEGLAPTEGLPARAPARPSEPLVLLHSGIVYPDERDPTALFEALGRLAARDIIRPGEFVIRFRASVHEALLRGLAQQHRVEAFVEIEPAVPYRQALAEMLDADALLVMQGANCNEQIPAKLYEYLRAGRPILALADPVGDTGRTLAGLGYPHVTPLESADAIATALPAFLGALREGRLPVAQRASVDRYSRRSLTGGLAQLLDRAARGGAAAVRLAG